ncbi:MAG TPA: futalosine hydrolase [Mycobacteriales bacterium]|nr:futalosine hydrolase [Mycobacteriales bacterium]
MTLLTVVATDQELAALVRDLDTEPLVVGPYRGCATPAGHLLVAGIGPAAAAAGTATALALGSYDVCLSVGICGAYRGTADIGDTVVATALVAADLGADSPSGFLGTGALGWAEDEAPVDPSLLATVVGMLGDVVTGPVLTVATVTGTRARADELSARHGAVAEAMEGWGVLTAALPHATPVLEVRTVSNLVEDRDISRWDIPVAFAALSRVGTSLLEEPWA